MMVKMIGRNDYSNPSFSTNTIIWQDFKPIVGHSQNRRLDFNQDLNAFKVICQNNKFNKFQSAVQIFINKRWNKHKINNLKRYQLDLNQD